MSRNVRILIVEDEPSLRDVLSRFLTAAGYQCDMAENGRVGYEMVFAEFEKAREHGAARRKGLPVAQPSEEPEGYDIILTDISMPEMTGLQFLEKIKPLVERVTPCMILTAFGELEYATAAMRLGACNFLQKNPFDPGQISDAVERAYEIRQGYLLRADYQARLEQELKDKTDELQRTYDGTVIGFAAMMEGKDASTMAHLFRVRDYCVQLAQEIGVPDSRMRDLKLGAMLHDIGKYSIPDAILTKPASLTDDEWVIMRTHPDLGAGFVRQIPFLQGATDVIQCHHERYDGDGYPNGLRGKDIPLAARIFSVVDAYDAIVSERCYKSSRPPEVAIEELKRCAGTQFDPDVVDAFERVMPEIVASMRTFEVRFEAELASLGLGQIEDRGSRRERLRSAS